jgi:uncharacterized membrane protein YfcA
MPPLLIVLFLCMFGVATGFSMLGQGGGALYTPIQVFFGINFHEAATTSLFLIMVTSLSATLVFRKAHKIDWPLAFVLEGVTTLGGLTGGLASGQFSGGFLSGAFAMVVAFAAIFMVREFHYESICPPVKEGWAYWHRCFGDQTYCVNLLIALPVSFIAGGVSGLVGVGGGILKVPLMVLLLGIPMDIAVGSSGFMVGLTAAGGFAGHVALGHWDWRTSLVLGIAVFLGGQIGARKSIKIDKKKMKKGFGWFLMVIAAFMVGKALL